MISKVEIFKDNVARDIYHRKWTKIRRKTEDPKNDVRHLRRNIAIQTSGRTLQQLTVH